MFDLAAATPERHPFDHCVIDGLFDAQTYRALAAGFPQCPPASGPTGYTIHRGDPQFDAVMAETPEWRHLFEHCHSAGFVTAIADLFADEIARACRVERAAMRFVDHIETRAEKERTQLRPGGLAPEDLFVRFDFMQGRNSYVRVPHLDHRRRLATMLVYFDSPGPDSFSGGDLVLHEADGNPGARIAPAQNRAVLFACSEKSWHSVEPVHDCRGARSMIQVSVSSRHPLWPESLLPGMKRRPAPLRWLGGLRHRLAS